MDKEDYYTEFEWVRPSAFIVYQPHRRASPEAILCNRNSWGIFTGDSTEVHEEEPPPDELVSLCKKWKTMLEENLVRAKEMSGSTPDSFFIDLFTSGRRKYRVKGFRLYDQGGTRGRKNSCFMFTLERIHRDSVNLPQIFRESKLSKREQDIIFGILADKGNKEIAGDLGLSLNTVKVYLKNLMRKLNVTSRAGILSFLLLTPSAKKHRNAARRTEYLEQSE